jgi:hypothetical protein
LQRSTNSSKLSPVRALPTTWANLLPRLADPYLGTELESEGVRSDDALDNLLSDEPLFELAETPDEGDRLSEEASLACR